MNCSVEETKHWLNIGIITVPFQSVTFENWLGVALGQRFSQLVERASSMRLLFIKLRAASSMRGSAHNRLTLLYRCVAAAISQCSTSREQIPKRAHTVWPCVLFKMSFRPCATGCGRYLALGDGHDHCLACLGLAYALIAGTWPSLC